MLIAHSLASVSHIIIGIGSETTVMQACAHGAQTNATTMARMDRPPEPPGPGTGYPVRVLLACCVFVTRQTE